MPGMIRRTIRGCCSSTSIWRVAVDTPAGLIVPVLRDIERRRPDELRAALAAQKDAAHRRSTAAGRTCATSP